MRLFLFVIIIFSILSGCIKEEVNIENQPTSEPQITEQDFQDWAFSNVYAGAQILGITELQVKDSSVDIHNTRNKDMQLLNIGSNWKGGTKDKVCIFNLGLIFPDSVKNNAYFKNTDSKSSDFIWAWITPNEHFIISGSPDINIRETSRMEKGKTMFDSYPYIEDKMGIEELTDEEYLYALWIFSAYVMDIAKEFPEIDWHIKNIKPKDFTIDRSLLSIEYDPNYAVNGEFIKERDYTNRIKNTTDNWGINPKYINKSMVKIPEMGIYAQFIFASKDFREDDVLIKAKLK